MRAKDVIVIVAIIATFGALILLYMFSNKFRLWLRYLGSGQQGLKIGTMTNYPNMEEIDLNSTGNGKVGFSYLQQDKPYSLSKDAWEGLTHLSVQGIADQIAGSVEYLEVSWNKTSIGQIADLYVRGVVDTDESVASIISKIKESSAADALSEVNAWSKFRAFRLS
jgi:hypothetical protein